MTEPSFAELLRLIERELAVSLTHDNEGFRSKRLEEAMRYALLSPGKRLRPIMTLASALACRGDLPRGVAIKRAILGACAVEYVHTYSLVHDDLPCMDDDDYRRGRLSVHRRFDEGLAVLVGDALLADAFLLAAKTAHEPVLVVLELARTAGSMGLVAGQAEDLAHTHETDQEAWLRINHAKTARLFEACAVIGGLSVGASKSEVALLRRFGQNFGAAFQVKDDIDDNSGVAALAASVKSLGHEHVERAHEHARALPHPQSLVSLLHFTFATLS